MNTRLMYADGSTQKLTEPSEHSDTVLDTLSVDSPLKTQPNSFRFALVKL